MVIKYERFSHDKLFLLNLPTYIMFVTCKVGKTRTYKFVNTNNYSIVVAMWKIANKLLLK